jgi:uncharacterized membrane protein
MRSKARVGSHPLHPMLVGFPIAFLVGGIIFDILSYLFVNEALYATSYHLLVAGIIMGVLAGIPGLVDFFYIIPQGTRAKKIATYHMLVNGVALVLFLVSVVKRPAFADRTVLAMLSAYIGLAVLAVGGWLGGSLVYEEKIGVPEDTEEIEVSGEIRWQSAGGEYGIHSHH